MHDIQPALWPHLPALLRARVAEAPEATLFTFIEAAGAERAVSRAALWAEAEVMAAGFQARGLLPGDRVAVSLAGDERYLAVLFGAWLAGLTVAPLPPVGRPEQLEGTVPMVEAIAPALVVVSAAARALWPAETPWPLVALEALPGDPAARKEAAVAPDAVAILQGTSGSTQAPRLAMLSHRAVLEGAVSLRDAFPIRPDDTAVIWFPLTHTGGLIFALVTLAAGAHEVIMSPLAVMADPASWLRAIARHRASFSGASTYAFQLLVDGYDPGTYAGLDLSSWRMAVSAGEPVQTGTLEAFCERFAAHGFSPDSLRTAYGMTEAAAAVSVSPPGGAFRVERLDAERLEREGLAVPLPEGAPGRVVAVASLGRPLPGVAARVVDAAGQVLGERRTGEIEVAAPSLMQGYWREPAATAAVLADGWLRTGDLGYMADGQLHVVGRLKDILMKGGRKVAAHDVEVFAAAVEGLRSGAVVAFGVPAPGSGSEAIVLVAETEAAPHDHPALAQAIQRRVWERLGLSLDRVALVPPGTITRTEAQKPQRAQVRAQWLAGALL